MQILGIILFAVQPGPARAGP